MWHHCVPQTRHHTWLVAALFSVSAAGRCPAGAARRKANRLPVPVPWYYYGRRRRLLTASRRNRSRESAVTREFGFSVSMRP
jgi:hypothetical protein